MDRRSCINNECDNQEYFQIIDYQKVCLDCGTIQQSFFITPLASGSLRGLRGMSANHSNNHCTKAKPFHKRDKYFQDCMEKNNVNDDNFKLFDDFRMLEEKWNTMENIKRINFLNYNYVLYQLLRRHNRPTENIKMLKSINRTKANDDICEKLFEELGWVFSRVAPKVPADQRSVSAAAGKPSVSVIKGWWVMVEDVNE